MKGINIIVDLTPDIDGVKAYKLETGKVILIDHSGESAKLMEFEDMRTYAAHLLIRKLEAKRGIFSEPQASK